MTTVLVGVGSVGIERIGGFTVRRLPLPDGDAGTRMTLGLMRQLAQSGSKDLEVRSAAIDALDRYGAQEHDPVSALRSIYRFVQDRIRFVPDPVGTQGVQSPRATLELGAGNCAQRATLIAALARSIGIPADLKFRVIAANPHRPKAFSHVYAVARIAGRDIPMDPTYRSVPFGIEYPRPTRMGEYPVMTYQQNGSGFPSCCEVLTPGTLGFSLNPFKLAAKVLRPALKVGSFFIPGGPVVSMAVGAAAGALANRIGRRSAPSAGKITPLIKRARGAIRTTPVIAPASVPSRTSPDIAMATPVAVSGGSGTAVGGGGGGGGGGGATAKDLDEGAPVAAGVSGTGPGVGIAIVLGVVLLALMRRNRRS